MTRWILTTRQALATLFRSLFGRMDSEAPSRTGGAIG